MIILSYMCLESVRFPSYIYTRLYFKYLSLFAEKVVPVSLKNDIFLFIHYDWALVHITWEIANHSCLVVKPNRREGAIYCDEAI